MADNHTATGRFGNWLRSAVAIIGGGSAAAVLGGAWVVYTFVFKEASKSHHIIPSIDARLLEPSPHRENGKFRAFELGFTVNNASEQDAYIIVGKVISFGHKARDASENIFEKSVDSRKVGPQLMMSEVAWQAERQVVGALITFQGFELSRAEKATQQYVLLVPSGVYDIFEIWAEFHVADACYGIYPLQTCYEFTSQFKWIDGECTRENSTSGKNACLIFYYRTKGAPDWLWISNDELRRSYGYRVFQTTRMIVSPEAPILDRPK
jgi:hypothetical protein